jgi:uncharacterized protein
MEIIQRVFPEPSQSYFLLGPRGTGKSTLMRTRYADAIWVDLLRPDIFRRYLARPEYLSEMIAGNPEKKVVVIDEIQKVPGLLSVAHSIIEEKKGIKFIFTGSSARKLKRVSANLLGGRALKRVLHPFMAAELGSKFILTKALQEGLLPLIISSANPTDVLQAYISLYLQEEVQAERLVQNIENFSRFLEVVSFSHGSILNVANIARECEVKRKTVENYIGVLEDLLLAYQLPVFSKRAQRELVSHTKFYLFDAGVYYAIRPKGPLDRPEEIDGVALEGLVFQHLRAWSDYSDQKASFGYWRTRAGVEVDFIISTEQNIWAIEVKNSQRVSSKDTKALEIFLQDYPMAKAILLYRGSDRIQIKNVTCIPCEEFLLQLKPNSLL